MAKEKITHRKETSLTGVDVHTVRHVQEGGVLDIETKILSEGKDYDANEAAKKANDRHPNCELKKNK